MSDDERVYLAVAVTLTPFWIFLVSLPFVIRSELRARAAMLQSAKDRETIIRCCGHIEAGCYVLWEEMTPDGPISMARKKEPMGRPAT